MKLSKEEYGLRAANFVNKKTLFSLCYVKEEQKKDKNGKEYKQYVLGVLGKNEDWIGDFKINFLFKRDLSALIVKYGEETDKWLGKLIEVVGVPDGEYYRWKILAGE